MKPKPLQPDPNNEWRQVTLYSFQHYWINTQTGRLFNERSGKFPKGSLHRGYRVYCLSNGVYENKSFGAHQLVYFSFNGYMELPKDWVNEQIDHIDRNSLNNCIDNLRLVSQRENAQNLGSNLPPGVYYNKILKVFGAQIRYKRRVVFLDYFPLPCLAAKAYEKAEQQINEGTFNPPDWLKRKGTSKYPGVSLCKRTGKWRARFRNRDLGRFSTEFEAHQAYVDKRKVNYV